MKRSLSLEPLLKHAMQMVAQQESRHDLARLSQEPHAQLFLEISVLPGDLSGRCVWSLQTHSLTSSGLQWDDAEDGMLALNVCLERALQDHGAVSLRTTSKSGYAWPARDLSQAISLQYDQQPLPRFRENLPHLQKLKALGTCLNPWPFSQDFWDLPCPKTASLHARLEWPQIHPDLVDRLEDCNAYGLLPMRWFKTSFGLFLGVENSQNPEHYRPLLLL